MKHSDEIILKKIVDEIVFVEENIMDINKENFIKDSVLQHAISMAIINVGELVKHVSEDVKHEYDNIPWKKAAGLRDVTAHGYGTLNMESVYETAVRDLPELKRMIFVIKNNG